ncbi:MAG: chitobiase/beta-hexosaminidase C-terminal domain-containing protein [bacterium]
MKIVGRRIFGVMGLVSLFATVSYGQNVLSATTPAPAAVPGSAGAQKKEYTPADEEAARACLDLLVTDEAGLRDTNLGRRSKDYVEIAALARAGRSAEAMERFALYFTSKLRYPSRFGISPEDLSPYRGWGLDQNPATPGEIAAADKLLAGTMTIDGKEVVIGPPGSVDWGYPWGASNPMPAGKEPASALFLANGFSPLVRAFVATHDQRYLDRWAAYMDDWSTRCTYFDKIHPCLVSDAGHNGALLTFRMLAAIATALPENQPVLPPTVLAHLLKRELNRTFLPMAYIRSNTHNWTPTTELLLQAMIFDESRLAPLWLRENRRRNLEDVAATQNLRDGTENQQDPWYSAVMYTEAVSSALRLLVARESLPIWQEYPDLAALRQDARWKNEIQEHLEERAHYLMNILTPQGEMPIPIRGGFKQGVNPPLNSLAPATYKNLENQAVQAARKDPAAGLRPRHNADWFPYSGFNIVREGWEKNSGHGDLFCSPVPGAYGAFRSRSNNNNFGLGAFGQDLLVDDATGHYMYPSSPITVDGRQQFFHAGLYKVSGLSAHKVFQVSAWTEPSPFRWHASDHFNLMEGVYAGPWGNLKDANVVNSKYGPDASGQGTITLSQTLRGITHQRQAMYVRGDKVWIITDRMLGNGSHTYEQNWLLPLRPTQEMLDQKKIPIGENALIAFAKDQIRIDAAAKRIITQADVVPGKLEKKANLSLYQFTTANLAYNTENTPPAFVYGLYYTYGWQRIGVKWQGEGPQQVVTLIVPRAPGQAAPQDLKSIEPLTSGSAGQGFAAVTSDGQNVRYLASTKADDELTIGAVKIRGEALLLAGDRGMALGCSSFSLAGKKQPLPATDFEFTLNTDHRSLLTSFIPIYRPIDPVTIGPERNVFADSVEVTLASKTPGVEIRYTLDGSDPTPLSPLYSAPVKLLQSTVVKARAYRPGVKENPLELSGTQATVPSMAVFDKAKLAAPSNIGKVSPGLAFRYFEDDWRTLWSGVDRLQPKATGNVGNLWDLNLVPADNPPVAATAAAPRARYYAVEYSGYLNIPEDGVYTLHAPREFVYPDVQSGYELKVVLGNRMDSGPWASGRVVGTQEWYPSTRLHALGNWSVALKKGLQPFKVIWCDFRTDAAQRLNLPGLKDYVWTGVTPDLRLSGPGLDHQPIPAAWMCH